MICTLQARTWANQGGPKSHFNGKTHRETDRQPSTSHLDVYYAPKAGGKTTATKIDEFFNGCWQLFDPFRPLQEQNLACSSGSWPNWHFIVWSFRKTQENTRERLYQAWRYIFCMRCIPKYNSNEILSHSRTVLLIYCTALLFHYFARVLLYAWTLDRSTTHRSKTHRKSVKLPWRRNIFFFCLVVFLSSCLVVFLSRL